MNFHFSGNTHPIFKHIPHIETHVVHIWVSLNGFDLIVSATSGDLFPQMQTVPKPVLRMCSRRCRSRPNQKSSDACCHHPKKLRFYRRVWPAPRRRCWSLKRAKLRPLRCLILCGGLLNWVHKCFAVSGIRCSQMKCREATAEKKPRVEVL